MIKSLLKLFGFCPHEWKTIEEYDIRGKRKAFGEYENGLHMTVKRCSKCQQIDKITTAAKECKIDLSRKQAIMKQPQKFRYR